MRKEKARRKTAETRFDRIYVIRRIIDDTAIPQQSPLSSIWQFKIDYALKGCTAGGEGEGAGAVNRDGDFRPGGNRTTRTIHPAEKMAKDYKTFNTDWPLLQARSLTS